MSVDSVPLTAEQIEALNLVRQNLSSKEIARLLGISKSAVDQRLDRARHVLGAASRREAARKFGELEACNRITRDPAALVYPAPAAALMATADADGPQMPQRVQTTHSAFETEPGIHQIGLRQLLRGIKPHELTTVQRIALTLLIAIGIPMLFGGLSMLLYGVVATGRIFLR